MTQILKKGKKAIFKGELLYDKRIRLGLTLKDIAKKVGLSMNAVHQWESGVCKPGPKSMRKLSKALEVDPEYFFNGKIS